MRRIVALVVLLCAPSLVASDQDAELTRKLKVIIDEVKLVQPGMTRGDLLKYFTTEGGISNRTQRRYVEKRCPYIKVDVEFKPVGKGDGPLGESEADIITHISEPFLQPRILD